MGYNEQSYEARCEAVRLWEQGVKGPELAERFGVTHRTIYNWVKRARDGESLRSKHHGQKRQVPPEDVERIKAMWQDGHSKTAIAAEVGWTAVTVGRVLDREGVTRGEVTRDIIVPLDVSPASEKRDIELRQLLQDVEYYIQESARIPGGPEGRQRRRTVKVRLTAWVGE